MRFTRSFFYVLVSFSTFVAYLPERKLILKVNGTIFVELVALNANALCY